MSLSRRLFLKTMAQSAAMVSFTGCAPRDEPLEPKPDGGGVPLDCPSVDEPEPGPGPESSDGGTPMVDMPPQASFAFLHGVASGDPTSESVVLWTRVTPDDPDDCPVLTVDLTVARDRTMADIVLRTRAHATPARDFTIHVDAAGLEPGATYFYRFSDPTRPDVKSDVGRTRTMPEGKVDGTRIAVVACSCHSIGFFNAYDAIAERDDIDLVLHLGDYIYEYGEGSLYDPRLGRTPEPLREIVTHDDYRTRHAQYKRDEALQALHRSHPMVCIWDDHDITNNAWRDGAENHQPATEGDYAGRKRVALDAYLEWLPVRVPDPKDTLRAHRSTAIGELCDLIVLDTRSQRDQQDEARVADPDRTLLGSDQAQWLESELLTSRERGVSWRILVDQVIMTQFRNLTYRNADTWDGYRASRDRLLGFIRDEGIDNVVVASGDWHSSWASEIAPDPFGTTQAQTTPVAVEFHCTSVTSPLPRGVDQFWVDAQAVGPHPHVHWAEFTNRGYLVLDITPGRVKAEWLFSRTVQEADSHHVLSKSFSVATGTSRLVEEGT